MELQTQQLEETEVVEVEKPALLAVGTQQRRASDLYDDDDSEASDRQPSDANRSASPVSRFHFPCIPS
jgi:hypothetical protein